MSTKLSTIVFLITVCGCVSEEIFAEDGRIVLAPDFRYSYCTTWQSEYSVGIVGGTWALTLSFPKDGFSGKVPPLCQDSCHLDRAVS
jgi:hypothetical protein